MNATFTDEQHAARWLAKFALPFVNSTPDQLRKAAFNAYAQNISKGICRCDGTDEVVEEFDFERYDIYKLVTDQELADLQKLIKTMLHIVLSDKTYEELPKDIKRQRTGIEREIKRIVAEKPEYTVEWGGKGKAFVLRLAKDEDDKVVSKLEKWFVLAITVCLQSFSMADEIEPVKGEGFEKLGMCPNCGVFFAKKRKDQEYCSVKCKGTMLKRIKRQSSKVC
jgi:ribosomal protein S27AE